MNKHLPAPWNVMFGTPGVLWVGRKNYVVAHVPSVDGGDPSADACLIATAPELLEALKVIKETLNALYIGKAPSDETIRIDSLILAAENLIEKAEGGSK